MKKKILTLTAVLLFAVLLFFLKEKGIFLKGEGPSGTPSPEPALPQVMRNAWILSSTEDSITLFYEGEEHTFMTRGKVQGTLEKCVGDVTVQGEEILSLVLKPDKITGKVLRVNDEGIELEGYGQLPFAEGFKVYSLYDGVAEEPSGKVLVGSSGNDFVLENGRLCASLLLKKPEMESIRVLIGTEGYKGYYHETLELVADCGVTITEGEDKKHVPAGEVCVFSKEYFEDGDTRSVITPDNVDGKITVRNLKRAGGAPAYRGTLEVEVRDEGLLLVNELSVEEYLYAVLQRNAVFLRGRGAESAGGLRSELRIYRITCQSLCTIRCPCG